MKERNLDISTRRRPNQSANGGVQMGRKGEIEKERERKRGRNRDRKIGDRVRDNIL